MSIEAMKLALEALQTLHDENMDYLTRNKLGGENNQCMVFAREAIKTLEEALAKQEQGEPVAYINIEKRRLEWAYDYMSWDTPTVVNLPRIPLYTTLQPAPQDEPVAWISVKDELPKAVRGVSYRRSLTDTVLVRHADRPDYPITAHAVVGEGLGAGIAIPTEGASEHPEIAWYSDSSNLNNPFGLKNQDYERFLPRIFGTKITHWMPIPDTTPQQRQDYKKPWVGLDKKDVDKAWEWAKKCSPYGAIRIEVFAKELEQALKERNI